MEMCFCCQWVKDNCNDICKSCPLALDCGNHNSFYKRWVGADDIEERKQLAVKIRDIPLVTEEITYKIGQRFSIKDFYAEEYLLVQINNNMVALINLITGNRFMDPIQVEDIYIILQKKKWISTFKKV